MVPLNSYSPHEHNGVLYTLDLQGLRVFWVCPYEREEKRESLCEREIEHTGERESVCDW